MKKVFMVLVANFAVSALSAQAVSCDKCDLRNVSFINAHIKELNEDIVERFLCTLDYSCKMNPKFLQLSNETLYKVLNDKPELVVACLRKYNTINKKLVYEMIENPTVKYDFEKILKQVSTINDSTKAKRMVAMSLKKASLRMKKRE